MQKDTDEYDKRAMRVLSIALYPIVGAYGAGITGARLTTFAFYLFGFDLILILTLHAVLGYYNFSVWAGGVTATTTRCIRSSTTRRDRGGPGCYGRWPTGCTCSDSSP